MFVIHNNILPFKGYKATSIWPFIFTRNEEDIDNITLCHETIHGCQQKEMLLIPFYLLYGIEWLIRFIRYRNTHKAYRNISFEKEAYLNEHDAEYIKNRKHYAWIKYLFK